MDSSICRSTTNHPMTLWRYGYQISLTVLLRELTCVVGGRESLSFVVFVASESDPKRLLLLSNRTDIIRYFGATESPDDRTSHVSTSDLDEITIAVRRRLQVEETVRKSAQKLP